MENNNRSNITLSDFILKLIHINYKLKKPPDKEIADKRPEVGER